MKIAEKVYAGSDARNVACKRIVALPGSSKRDLRQESVAKPESALLEAKTANQQKKEPNVLVLSRQKDESIIIGDDVEITIVDVRGDKVRLGINAPRSISVHRKEIYEAIQREKAEKAKAEAAAEAAGETPPESPAKTGTDD